MNGRLTCIVDGCKRSRRQNKVRKIGEWLCPKHWRMVEPGLRRLHKSTQRKARLFARRGYTPRLNFVEAEYRRWEDCKGDVTMKLAMGVSTDGRF